MKQIFNYSGEYRAKSESVLNDALENVPFYKSWKQYDPGRFCDVDERYAALPELTKKDMRENFPNGLVSNMMNVKSGVDSGEISFIATSGTTEEKVVNIWNQKWWESGERASWKLNTNTLSMSYPQKEAEMASALSVGFLSDEDLPVEQRMFGHTLYLNEKASPDLWQKYHFKRIADEMNSYRPVILEANPSYLARFVFWAMDNDVEVFSPKVIIFTYELPSVIHLAAIRKVFSSPFISSYGSTESGFVLQQCECGLMHQNIDCCRIDFNPVASRYGTPWLGRMLVTTFDNPWAVIIRFDIGDLVKLSPDGNCKCGRKEGLTAMSIEGRIANITFTTAGDIVTPAELDRALALIPQIRDYSLNQVDLKTYELLLVISVGGIAIKVVDFAKFCGTSVNSIIADAKNLLANLYGSDGVYRVTLVNSIAPSPSGKFRRSRTNFKINYKNCFDELS